jgi:phosphocarrier protein HPr
MSESPSSSQRVKIVNLLGLHARAAGKLMNLAIQFNATVSVEKDTQIACADSVMELMMLTAGPGDTVTIKTAGPDASAALKAIVTLVEEGFGEDLHQT